MDPQLRTASKSIDLIDLTSEAKIQEGLRASSQQGFSSQQIAEKFVAGEDQQEDSVQPVGGKRVCSPGTKMFAPNCKHGRKQHRTGEHSKVVRDERISHLPIFVADEDSEDEVQVLLPCKICFENIVHTQIHSISACSHHFCCSCLDNYIAQSAKEQKFPVACPEPKCAAAISMTECAKILTSQEFMNTLQRLEVENSIPDDEKFFCPLTKCSALLTRPSVIDGTGFGKCLVCHNHVCMRCKTPWHDGLSCEQYQKLPLDARSAADQQLARLAAKRKWQACAKCNRVIERNKGCPHMTCVCGYQFCYTCGKEWGRCSGYRCRPNRAEEPRYAAAGPEARGCVVS